MVRKYPVFMAPLNPDEDRTEHLWILFFCAGAILCSFLMDLAPDGSLRFSVPGAGAVLSLPPFCMSTRLFGITCPGCGLTRSFVAVAHGEYVLALQMNGLGPVLFFLACLQIPYRIVEYLGVFGGSTAWRWLSRAHYPVAWIILAALVGNWIWHMM
jgi:hypothetical protein